jgi:hypothetical protein
MMQYSFVGGSALSLGSPHSKKPMEVTSILKRRNSPDRGIVYTASGNTHIDFVYESQA